MSITLSPKAEAIVRQFVARGHYHDPESVVMTALQALAERDQLAQLQAAIAVGDEQLARGQVIQWTSDTLDRLKQEAEELVRMGRPFKDDVIP